MKTPMLFVTGTDTEVGKTYITTQIARELVARKVRVGAYKPVCSGSVPGPDGTGLWEDVQQLSAAIGGGFDSERICPQCFTAAMAPTAAARLEGKKVDADEIRSGLQWWQGRVDLLLIEGVGGLLCPLTEKETIADFAADVCCPLLIVSRLGLGTINHTLLTVEVARTRGLNLAGIVMNEVQPRGDDFAAANDVSEIESRCDVPVLSVVEHGWTGDLQHRSHGDPIDWLSLVKLSSGTD